MPIRLGHTPTRCRVRPVHRVKFVVGRRPRTACNAEQRAEGVERVEAFLRYAAQAGSSVKSR